MTTRGYTIGRLSRLSGIPARKIRFYVAEGLLPPSGRTESGYRLFDDADLARLELIRSLREAGASLDMIRGVLGRRLSLKDVLALRLAEVEANAASQRRLAATLRAALKSDEPSHDDLRRIKAMTDISHAERRHAVRDFYERATSGIDVDPQWKLRMVEWSTPELPDEPTTEQVEAWIEMSALFADPAFVEKVRAQARDMPPRDKRPDLNVDRFIEMQARMTQVAREAIRDGISADSEIGRALAEEHLATRAQMAGRELDDDFRERERRFHWQHWPNMKRYNELLRILRGIDTPGPSPETEWVQEAIKIALKPQSAASAEG